MGGVQWKPRENNDSIRCEINHLQALRMTSLSIQKQVDRIRYGLSYKCNNMMELLEKYLHRATGMIPNSVT
jgi:hypothetical protein